MEQVNLNQYEKEVTCNYRNETYSVRDNGAIFRHRRIESQLRPLDEKWTFGNPCKQKGYFNFSSETVHRIVATAFHRHQPSNKHVVDHIDTNKKNNRPENLRWVTRLENILLNPITLSRVIYKYGSVDNFFSDPSKPLNGTLDQNFEWMRTVTKEEFANTKNNLLNWAKGGKISKEGALGEWIFYNIMEKTNSYTEQISLIESFTKNAVQRNWKTPSEFPCCPQEKFDAPIVAYTANLKDGKIFSRNQYSNSVITDFAISKDEKTLWVMSMSSDNDAVKPWSLAQVTYENNLFVHTNLGSYFKKIGAEKQFTLAQGLEWTGEDSIDDFT